MVLLNMMCSRVKTGDFECQVRAPTSPLTCQSSSLFFANENRVNCVAN